MTCSHPTGDKNRWYGGRRGGGEAGGRTSGGAADGAAGGAAGGEAGGAAGGGGETGQGVKGGTEQQTLANYRFMGSLLGFEEKEYFQAIVGFLRKPDATLVSVHPW